MALEQSQRRITVRLVVGDKILFAVKYNIDGMPIIPRETEKVYFKKFSGTVVLVEHLFLTEYNKETRKWELEQIVDVMLRKHAKKKD